MSELHRRHRAIKFKKIDKAVPTGLDVHLVCDNYATHNTAEIRTWLSNTLVPRPLLPDRIFLDG
jgi:hypothetical protein